MAQDTDGGKKRKILRGIKLKNMRQRLFVSAVFVLLTGACYAQWTKEDSLRLKKSLKEGEELKLNKEAVRQIDLNAGAANPRVYEEKRWMRFDKSLPRVISPSAVVESDTLYDKRRITGGNFLFKCLKCTSLFMLTCHWIH